MRRRRSLVRPEPVIRKAPTLAEIMNIGLLVHDDGVIWVFHEKAFPEPLDYVEYDSDERKISFIGNRGMVMDLGLPIQPTQDEGLMKCEYLMAAHVENNDVQDLTMVAVATRKAGLEVEGK